MIEGWVWWLAVIGGAVCVAACCGVVNADPLVTLTVAEREGTARAGEMVVTGVPLPEGRVKDATTLALTDAAGHRVPAEVRPVTRWPDGSIRWVHLYFPADCPAAKAVKVTLTGGRVPTKAVSPLTVGEADGAITVVTGPLKFIVRTQGFNLIDAAWIDETGRGTFDEAHQVIAPHTQGAVVRVDGKDYAAGNDRDVTVRVEEQGPMHVVIKAAGAHRNEKGEKQLNFVARLYAFAGSPAVKLVYTFVNAQGADRQVPIRVDAIHLDPVSYTHLTLPTN